MITDLRHFRATVREYRSDSAFMSRLFQVLAIVAIVMLTITAHTMTYQAEVLQEAHHEAVAKVEAQGAVWASLVAACMRSGQFVYVEPHTGASIGVFCDAEMLGKVGR